MLKALNPANRKKLQWLIKRLLDITLSILGLIVLSPLFFLVSIIIKFSSKGPAIFKQKRMGLYKKEFNMYKFRTMSSDAECRLDSVKGQNQTNPIMFKMIDDPRATEIGKFLRKHSLDELPQLINVIKGEMSLVGPRPPLPSEVENYQDWHYVRFATKPGMTGLWQVSGRSKIKNFDKVVDLDFKYIKAWSILLDKKILLKTIPVVLLGNE